MSLLDDLRNLLTKHLSHIASLTNQGTLHLVEDHLKRLEAVGPDIVAAEEEVHRVLDELYAALNAPAPVEQAPAAPEAPPTVAQPADTSWAAEPAPAPELAAEPAPAEEPPTGMH